METAPVIGGDQGQVALYAAVVIGCLLVLRGLIGLLRMWGRSGRAPAFSLWLASLGPKSRRTRIYRTSAPFRQPPGFTVRASPSGEANFNGRKRGDRAVATLPKAGAANPALGDGMPAVLRRLKGDLEACASVNAIAALLEEPRYRERLDWAMVDAILERSLAFEPEMQAVRAILEGGGLNVSPPHAYEKRVVRLLPNSTDGPERWNHRSAFVLCAAFEQSRRRRLLRPAIGNNAAARHGIDLLIYFDGDCRLIGWEHPGEAV